MCVCSDTRPGDVRVGRTGGLQEVFMGVRQQRDSRDKCVWVDWSIVHVQSDHRHVAGVLDGVCVSDSGSADGIANAGPKRKCSNG